MNKDLRRKIVELVYKAKDGHIPSAFSILDIVNFLYKNVLKVNPSDPRWPERDYFILSKGHGCLALYTVLHRCGFLTDKDLEMFCQPGGILGEHPDCTKVPGVEASTGSLGHGFPFSVGLALGLRIKGLTKNKVVTVMGDGECHEGTIWEAANVGRNLQLGNLCAIVDWNGSASQLMAVDDLPGKWRAFGWQTFEIDGHSERDLHDSFERIAFSPVGIPSVIIAKTTKGKGVPMLEGHGTWHHRIPNEQELKQIMEALS